MTKSQRTIEEVQHCFDEEASRRYRLGDEKVVRTSDTYRHYGSVLRELSSSVSTPLDVLDVGCGAGRYFHCLKNVRRLVGLDVSAHMIEQARNPVKVEEIAAESIELVCGDVFTAPLKEAAFDLVYSIGVYGEYSRLDDALLARLASVLRPSGTLFITAVDSRSRVSFPESRQPTLLRRLVRKAFPVLPGRVRGGINRIMSPHYLSRSELESLFLRSVFRRFAITTYDHVSGWQGTHWDCVATR